MEANLNTEWPRLKQFKALTSADFESSAVWVQVWTMDHGKPWRDNGDEETFRPWLGTLPVDPEEGDYLARATLILADGTPFPGFMSPIPWRHRSDLGFAQPRLFAADGTMHSFWKGILSVTKEEMRAFYSAVGRRSDSVFPIHVKIEAALARGCTECKIAGFASTRSGKVEFVS